ncbi:hypothetical protein [Flavobacterium urocaniciphilum]|uniref:DUF4367 domain-containing protein n=1 Tax=Flavobacterium urocaniciphilum TaxID=1299341 RepID=A0A1H8Z348_9FLAO|nr:hypothetical protein [Flavobacterium urocaniciphilum]SEP58761.1 hypothetical protein SAMN05444005_101455 [Flavobacterium urocaniciphilum]
MKLKFTLLLFILTSLIGFSQNLETMKKDVQKIYDLTIEKKYDIVLESTYPKVFEIVSKDDMKKMMYELLDNDQMKISYVRVEPNFTFSEIITINNGKYCIVEHNNSFTIKFKEELGENKELILENLKQTMVDYKVTIDEKTETFILDGKAQMIAISDELTKGTWKFINYNGESPMMKQVLSEEVLTKLGL